MILLEKHVFPFWWPVADFHRFISFSAKNDKHAGKGKNDEEKAPLSELVEKLNDRFGTDFTKEDMLVVEQFVVDMEKDKDLYSVEHFKFPFNDAFMGVVVDRMVQNKTFCERVLDDDKFSGAVKDLLVGYVYDRLRTQAQ